MTAIKVENPLSKTLLDTIKIARARGVMIHDLREALVVSFDVIAERDQTIKRQDQQIQHLRVQLRASVSGRTIAEQRQLVERIGIDRDYEALEHGLVDDVHGEAA